MDTQLSLQNAEKLRKAMEHYRPVSVETPFDILCYVALEFSKMALDQYVEELRSHDRRPQDRGS